MDSRVGTTAGRVIALLLCGTALGCAPAALDPSGHQQVTHARVWRSSLPVYGFRIVRTYPHDVSSYTEGLTVHDGALYEGTGLYGRSRIRMLDLATGAPIAERPLGREYFGEGVAVLGDLAYQLTYDSNVGFAYDRITFEPRRTFRYPAPGRGLTTDGRRLIMSNGSAALVSLDPATMESTGYVVVADEQGPVGFLAELEWIDGKVYANVWQTDYIAVASPETGRVVAWIDLSGLNPDPARLRYPLVLNGIARAPDVGALLVTGKEWPRLYAIDLVPLRNAAALAPGALP